MELNVFNGDFACGLWTQCAYPGESLVWKETYLEGPLPDTEDLEAFRAARAEFLSGFRELAGIGTERLSRHLRKLDNAILDLPHDATLMLWFDPCIFDQTILMRILYLLARSEQEPQVFLYCSSSHCMVKDDFQEGASRRVRLLPQDWETAAEAWRLFVQKDAAAIRELAARANSWERLPQMPKALLRCAEDFPGENGLTRTRRQLLEIVASGRGTFPEIFKALDAFEEYPFLGDTACERQLDALVREGFLGRCGERYELSRSCADIFTEPVFTPTGETPMNPQPENFLRASASPRETFALSDWLRETRAWFDGELDRLVPAADTRPARLHAAMRHSLFAGGKRIRPLLCFAAAEAAGASPDAALLPAAAIECLHTYTLIHDDLPCMDDDDLRRGVPTCHKAFDEATALLAGDALQALAFSFAARTPVRPAEVAAELAFAAGSTAVVGGQVEDMLSEGLPPDAERLEFIELHKTADLIRAACRMGAIAADASPGVLSALSAYADALGIAFQVADDILNATSTAERLGKAVGTDAERGKLTAVSVYGLDGARARLDSLTGAALAAIAPLPSPAAKRLAALALWLNDRTN